MQTDFEVLQRGEGVLYGACGGLWVMIIFAPPKVADMRLSRPSLTSMAARHPKGFPTLTWVLPTAGFGLETEARRIAAETTRAFKAEILSMGTLIEGTGFQAAAVRAILAGVAVMDRATAPRKIFANLAEAVEWTLSIQGSGERPALGADALIHALGAMRGTVTANA